MKFRTTYILLVIALAMGLFIYFYEIKGGKSREEAKKAETMLFKVKDKDISWVEILRPGLEPLRVERTGDGDDAKWNIVKPIETRADDSAVGSLTWQLAQLSFSQIVAQSPSDLAPFGLVTPEMTVKFGEGKGGPEWTLNFGGKVPMGGQSYAMAPDQDKVVAVSESARSTFDKQTIDLRDKRVVVFDDDKLVGLEISTPEQEIKFEKTADNWNITSPIKADADNDKVSKLLDDLRFLEVEEFIPSVVADSMGLSTPEMTITLVSGADQKARQKVDIFTGKEDAAYARTEGSQWVYKISSEFMNGIITDPQEFRERKVVKVDRWDVEQIRIKGQDGKPDMLIGKNEAGDWKFIEPADAKEEIVGSKVYDILGKIEELSTVAFVDSPPPADKTALKQAFVLYKAKKDDKGKVTGYEEIGSLWLGAKTDDGLQYARGSGPQIFQVATDIKVPAQPKDLAAGQDTENQEATPEFDEDE